MPMKLHVDFLLVMAHQQSPIPLSTLLLPFSPLRQTVSTLSLVEEPLRAETPNSKRALSQVPLGKEFKSQRLVRYDRCEQYRRSIIRDSSYDTKAGGLERGIVLYTCSLCHFLLPRNSEPYCIPVINRDYLRDGDSNRIFCKDCWIWIYNLAICWACGEIVGRDEERIGFGWCWWHWGCLNCMSCRVREFSAYLRHFTSF